MRYICYVLWLSVVGFLWQNKALKPKEAPESADVFLAESELGQLLAAQEADFLDEAQSAKIFSRIHDLVVSFPEKRLSKKALNSLISYMDPGCRLLSTHRAQLYQLFEKSSKTLIESPLLSSRRGSLIDLSDSDEDNDDAPKSPERAHRRLEGAVQTSSVIARDESAEIFSRIVDHITHLPRKSLQYWWRGRKMRIDELIGIINQYDPERKKLSPDHRNSLVRVFT